MAASEPKADYFHRVQQHLQDSLPRILRIKEKITAFRIEPQMTDCCIYAVRIVFEA